MMWDNDYGWGAWLAMTVGMVAFWAFVVVVFVAVVRSLRDDSPRGDRACRLLDERFACGDIDEQEYRTRRELLRTGQNSTYQRPLVAEWNVRGDECPAVGRALDPETAVKDGEPVR